MALVDNNSKAAQFCGGALVASKYVVSAAHCMASSNGSSTPKFKVKRKSLINWSFCNDVILLLLELELPHMLRSDNKELR